MNKWICLTVIMVTLAGCESRDNESQEETKMDIQVTSTAFEDRGMIPSRYTADGQDISPPIAWTGVPDGTKSIAIINDDPDAPMGTWVHWLIWNIPAEVTSLNEDIPAVKVLADGSCQGTTDFRHIGYGGPAPPSGVHRYFFKVYALDAMLDLPAGATKPELEKAIAEHILAQGQLMGRYTRQR